MTEIQAFYGQCKIASLVTSPNPFVGISDYDYGIAAVRLNQPEVTWDITSQPNNQGLRLSIGGFSYTGVDKETATVFSTNDASQDVEWYAVYREAEEAYSVEAGYDRSQVWSVSDTSDPDSPIILKTIEIIADVPLRYLDFQLFKPVQLGLD